LLPTNYYHDQKIFDQEIKKIFQSQWIFFGLVQEFEGDGSYVRKTLCENNIFLLKNQERYVGYLNRCPHRFHPIVTDDRGTSKLVCPYHYWAFEGNGALKGIPYETQCYQFTEQEKARIHLTAIAVERIGSLLFINFSKHPKPIKNQFHHQLLLDITSLSSHFWDFQKITFCKKFNWKLIQENLRDGLHPAFLHQKTLLNAIEFAPPAIPKDVPIQLLRNKDLSYGGPDVKLTHPSELKDEFQDPWLCEPRYYNYHVFPSAHIAAPDGGNTFVLENFIPLGPDETELEVYFVLTKNELSADKIQLFFDKLITNASSVYEEDFRVLENIQQATKGSITTPNNGRYERLITRFHKGYLKILGLTRLYVLINALDILKSPFFLLNCSKTFKRK